MFVYADSASSQPGYAVATGPRLCLLPPSASPEIAREVFLLLARARHDAELTAENLVRQLASRCGEIPFGLVTLVPQAQGGERMGLAGDLELHGYAERPLLSLPGHGEDGPSAELSLLPLGHGIVRAALVGVRTAERGGYGAARAGIGNPGAVALAAPAAAPVLDPNAFAVMFPSDEPAPCTDPVPTESNWWLGFPDGRELLVDQRIRFGRRRGSPDDGTRGGDGLIRIRIGSPRREISARHLELVPTAVGLLARDLASKNGTLVNGAHGTTHLIEGAETTLRDGDRLELGEDFEIRVIDRSGESTEGPRSPETQDTGEDPK
ncbi:FHA domain-containing protein [Mycetocola spongiae]|uniref:FHA domain-containing protein n=1 Tax=Mycetocola spongiae TaxID=2859226 RepID=UPI001CF54C32|nr:FHA domain-containing protein [Mycetocola spongiae]UCR90390.1 FHA domain-containing protein [Mycetocola spongiae]